jgi:hypothetical protein
VLWSLGKLKFNRTGHTPSVFLKASKSVRRAGIAPPDDAFSTVMQSAFRKHCRAPELR